MGETEVENNEISIPSQSEIDAIALGGDINYTVSELNLKLLDLWFKPRPDKLPVGESIIIDLNLRVYDNEIDQGSDNIIIPVTISSINQAPVLSYQVQHFQSNPLNTT